MTGDIPVIFVQGRTLAEAWENSLIELYEKGMPLSTQYDKPGDPPSKDTTAIITIQDPMADPMIHRDFPGGMEDLQEYVMEVLYGIKDHWVRDPNNPEDTKWEYTYHQRLFGYDVPGMQTVQPGDTPILVKADPINQIEIMCQKLAACPFTRRAQAITWKVWEDNDCYDPACLQSIWCRCMENEDGVLVLNTNLRMRSNDAYKAAMMNMFAFVMLQEAIAARIAEIAGREVIVGRYVHMADSYHLYGSYFKEFEERFLKNLQAREFEDRVYNYADWKDYMDHAIPAILNKVRTCGIV